MRQTAERADPAPAARGRGIGIHLPVLALTQTQRLLLGLVFCYLVLGFAASVFTPPWQSPDEPAHFEHAMLTPYGTDAELPQVQQPIIHTFEQFRFYEFRRLPTPEHEPTSFSAISWAIIRQVSKTPLYYQLAWLAASWTDDTILQLYSMRWLSVVLSAITIPLAYAVVRELLPPDRRGLALLGAAFVALLPMYGYIGASVNSDTIGAPIAAAGVLFAVRALGGKQPLVSAILALATCGLAVFVRRSSVVLLPWAVVVVLLLGLSLLWRRLPRLAVLVGSALALVACCVAIAWPSQLTADWYPDGQTTRSRADGGFESPHAFSLAARPDGSQTSVSYQIPLHQLAQLHGTTLQVSAEVRGEANQANGTISITSQKDVFASASVAPTSDWRQVTLQASIPDTAQSLFITIAGAGASPILFDDIRVERLPDGGSIALSNGGAEEAYTWWQARFLSQPFVEYTARIGQALRLGIYTSPQAWQLYPWYLENLSTSLIGRFGWMALGIPLWIENTLLLTGAFLLLGCVLAWRRVSTIQASQRRAIVLLAILVAGGVLTLLLEYTQYLSVAAFPQGRYMFPFLAPLAALLIIGLSQWLPPRFDRAAIIAGTSGFVVLHLWCWFGLIVPYFYA